MIGAIGVLVGIGLVLATPAARGSSGVRVAAIVGGLAIALPFVLSATPLDYFKDRNLIAAWIPLSIAYGSALALARPRPLAAAALAAVAVAGIGVAVAVERTPSLQRTDWRGASRALGQPILARGVIVAPAEANIALGYYGQSLVPAPIGARVREIDIVGEGIDVHEAAPPGFVATLRESLPGLAVLRFQAAKPITITPTVIKLAGGSMLLELGRSGEHWIGAYFADLAAWKRALADIAQGPDPRAVLAAAPAAADALKPLPLEIPTAGQLLRRLRQIALLATKVAAQPDATNETVLRAALTGR